MDQTSFLTFNENGRACQGRVPDENRMSCDRRALTWYLYLLQSEVTKKIYTGISPQPIARLRKHNAGKGAKATRAGRPWVIVYLEPCGTKSCALRREAAIKRWPPEKKLELAKSWTGLLV